MKNDEINDINVLQEVANDIIVRTNGEWNQMTLSDKLILKHFCCIVQDNQAKLKPSIDAWTNVNISDEISNEKCRSEWLSGQIDSKLKKELNN